MNRSVAHLTDAVAQQWVDGALSDPEAARAAEHAATCPDCAALAESYRVLSQALDALPTPDLPDDFTAAVLMRVEARELALSRERRTAVAVLASIAIALAAAVVIGGNGAWVPGAAQLADLLGSVTAGARLGKQVLGPVLTALRLPIAAVCAALFLPLLLALSRLTLSTRTEAH